MPLDNLRNFRPNMDSNPRRSEFLAPSSWFTDARHYIHYTKVNQSVGQLAVFISGFFYLS